MKIAVAMSGGVDSSVAAALLLKKGHDVFGLTMKHYDNKLYGFSSDEGIDASIKDARIVADKLGIKHHIADLQKDFKEIVESNFVEEYRSGRTPNPCTLCNPTIKWGKLLEKALELGAEKIASGHFVGLKQEDGYYNIYKGSDRSKDQSYMLWALGQKQLAQTLFPVSELSKKKVRKIANELQLPVHDKEESQEICFIKGHYEDYLKEKIELLPGNIVLSDGKIIGRHRGLPLYTIGQRKGLNTPWSSPLYVLRLNIPNNELIVTEDPDDLLEDSFIITNINWIQGKIPNLKDAEVQIRYNSSPVPIKEYLPVDDKLKIVMEKSTRAITPGQSAVFYRKDKLLGGGIII
ncbi:tRNA 2-thiouridine(34) synthase MnmA [Candidatus Cloacimonadota bacterium]